MPAFIKVTDETLIEGSIGFDAEQSMSDFHNIVLSDGVAENFALFEYAGNDNYYGHYFFSTAKGRKAIALASDMLKSLPVFDERVESVYGVVPVENKKASWLSRQIGFKKVSSFETSHGKMELFRLGLKEYE